MKQIMAYQRWLNLCLGILCAYYILAILGLALLPTQTNFSLLATEDYPAAPSTAWSWFKSQTVEVAKPSKPKPVARKRNINARLLGIIKTSAGSIAIIDTNKNGQSMVYREGDTLKSGIIVEKIENHRVLLNDNGIISSLVLDFKTATIGGENEQNGSAGKLQEVTQLNKLMPQNLRSPLLAGVRFVKTAEGGTAMSLGGINAEFLQNTDLESDDLVTAADGTPVGRILASPNSYQSMLQQDRVELSVVRNGKPESVYVNPRALLPQMLRLLAQKK